MSSSNKHIAGGYYDAKGSNSTSPITEDPINLAVLDNGNNTFTLKYDFNAATLYFSPHIVLAGSSTANGASAEFNEDKYSERLNRWVTGNTTNGKFTLISMNGLYTDRFLPDDSNTGDIDQDRSIDGVLAIDPTIVIISLPTNDLDSNSTNNSKTVYINNLKKIQDRCKLRNVHCFICATQPRTNFSASDQQKLYDVANNEGPAAFGNMYINIFNDVAKPYTVGAPAEIKDEYFGDSIHLNGAGHGVLAEETISVMNQKFINKPYLYYIIERSTSSGGSWQVFETEISTDILTKTYSRTDDVKYYYRVRALRTDGSFTDYSNVVELQQSKYVGLPLQTVKFNLTISGGTSDSSWNDLMPVGAEITIPTNKVFTGITDSVGGSTSYTYQSIGVFSFNTNGLTLDDYPPTVGANYWYTVKTSSIDLTPPNPGFIIHGCETGYTYNVKILCVRNASGERLCGAQSSLKYGFINAGKNEPPVLIELNGITPQSNGDIRVYFRSEVFGFAYLNAVILEKADNIFKIVFPSGLANATGFSPEVDGIADAANTLKLVLNGNSTGLSNWFNANLQTGSVITLNNSLGDVDTMTITVNAIATSSQDNGPTYAIGSVIFPSPVLRYRRYRTLGYTITLGNCLTEDAHRILICASVKDGSATTRYTINGLSKTLGVGDNSTYVEFLNVNGDTNQQIKIDVLNNVGSGTAYINAIIIVRSPANNSQTSIAQTGLANAIGTTPFTTFLNGPYTFPTGLATAIGRTPTLTGGGAPASPREWFTVQNYRSNWPAFIYLPPGYRDVGNTKTYPLLIFFHGSNKTSLDQVDNEGPALYFSNGDSPADLIAIIPFGIGINNWNGVYLTDTIKYMRDNYQINMSRIYLTGLSLGAGGSLNALQNTTDVTLGPNAGLVAAVMPISGAYPNAYPFSQLVNMPIWVQHGTADTNAATAEGNAAKLLQLMNPVNPKYNPICTYNWNVGHNSTMWASAYNRKNRTYGGGGTSKFDYLEWMMKYSNDAEENADLHVKYAETVHNWGDEYVDYLNALYVVNLLPSSTLKTDLLARLVIVKNNRLAGTFYNIDFGESGTQSTGNTNNMINGSTGQQLLNIVNTTGGTSTIDLIVTTALGSDTDGVNLATYFNGRYYGQQKRFCLDGFSIAVGSVGGTYTLSSLNPAKKYTIRLYHGSISTNFTFESRFTVVINGVSKSQYSEFNNVDIVRFDDIVPNGSNQIAMNIKANGGKVTHLVGITIHEHD